MAGFGVGIGDVIALSRLGITLYRGCKEADDAYVALSDEVNRFCATVQYLQNALPTQQSIDTTIDRRQNQELSLIIRNAQRDLEKWEKILYKHRNVGSGSRRSKWTANMRFATTDDASAIQSGLVSYTRSLTFFMSTLTSRRIEHIESHLERILSEIQNGFRDYYVQVQPEDDNIVGLEAAQWEMLQNELLSDGFVPEDISAHKAWFEERLCKIGNMPIPPAQKTKSPPPQLKATPTPLNAVKNSTPKEPVFTLCKDTILTIKGLGGKRLYSMAGDEFALLRVTKIRPGQADLWLCRHVVSSNIVELEASSLRPSVPGTTETEWRRFGLSKGFEAEAPTLSRRESNSTPLQTDRMSASSTRVQSSISNTTRTSLMRSGSSGPTLMRNGNEPLVSPRNILDRRNSDLGRGRSTSISSTTLPARPPSRAQSVHSEITEYGPDGKLVKTKTITTTYSGEVDSHSHIQTQNQTRIRRRASLSIFHNEHSTSKPENDNILYEPHSAGFLSRTRNQTRSDSHITHIRTNSNPNPASNSSPKTNSTLLDYETMYTIRTRQLKTLVRKLVELDIIRSDPFSYHHDEVEVSEGDFAVESICLALAGSGFGREGGGKKEETGMRKTKLDNILLRRGRKMSSDGGVGLDIVGNGPKGRGGVLNWVFRSSSSGDGGGNRK